MVIQDMEAVWQCRFPKQPQRCHVISIKTKDRLMVQDIVIHSNQCWWRKCAYVVARDFSDEVWLQKIFEGSTKTRMENCKKQRWIFCDLRAIQGHSVGIPIEPELMGYVFILRNWKSTYFIEAFHGTSILSWEIDWFWVEKRKIKPVRQSFQHNWILLEMTRRKKSLMMITQFHEKYFMLLVGNTTKMQFSGYDYQKRRIKDWNSGRRSHLQSWPTLRYLEIVLIVWPLNTKVE